jgi:hypothetical protein
MVIGTLDLPKKAIAFAEQRFGVIVLSGVRCVFYFFEALEIF